MEQLSLLDPEEGRDRQPTPPLRRERNLMHVAHCRALLEQGSSVFNDRRED